MYPQVPRSTPIPPSQIPSRGHRNFRKPKEYNQQTNNFSNSNSPVLNELMSFPISNQTFLSFIHEKKYIDNSINSHLLKSSQLFNSIVNFPPQIELPKLPEMKKLEPFVPHKDEFLSFISNNLFSIKQIDSIDFNIPQDIDFVMMTSENH